ncbi:MAG: ABC transporter ATP-binding protein [Chloroflexi bacterium]|nr:ABC transporter ATP-binding protein [Chloroflexota bacterium]MDA1297397.1 ABC transporter ATP-binding protein [Chloroflexota bacterium]
MAFAYRWRMALAIVSTIIAAVFILLIPQLLGNAIDDALNFLSGETASKSEAQRQLLIAALLLFGANVLRGIFTMVHNYMGESIGQHIGYELRMAFYRKLQRMSYSYHNHVHTGDLMTRGMLDIEGVRLFVNTALLRVLLLAILIGGGTYLVVRTDLVLGLVSLSFVPIVAWRAISTRLKLHSGWRNLQEKLSILTRVMDENLSGIRVVRAFAGQDYELRKFNKISDEAQALANGLIGIRVRNTSFMSFTFMLAVVAVVWLGGLKVIDGELTVGDLTEFLAFMFILQMPVRQLGMMVNGFARSQTSGTRLFEILDLDPIIKDKPDAKPLKVEVGVLRFEHVGFSFMDEFGDEQILRDISFEARPGHTVGIVGPPGSGKSTLAHLVPRFYDVTAGRITIDGHDIRDVQLESLRRAVGVVQQDTFMFTSSIENNVAYGDPWAETETIHRATTEAQLHDWVRRLPREYETLVGERGVSLSGGQRQRLSIARSLMLNPKIIIFDDSTAAIDAATEQRIRAALKEITKERAVIIISHRLSSLMHANEILFLDGGQIVERGSHEELIAMGGGYHDLYELQIRPGDDVLSRLTGHGEAGPAADPDARPEKNSEGGNGDQS